MPCRDGEQIENEEEKYLFSDDSSELTIRKVDKNDEAEYVCIAENKAGEQDASIHLKVFGKDREVKVTPLPQLRLPHTVHQQDPVHSAWEPTPLHASFTTSALVQAMHRSPSAPPTHSS